MDETVLEKWCREYNSDEDHNGNYGHYLADLVLKQRKEAEKLNKRAEFENYLNFVNAVKKSGVNIDGVFVDAYEKQNLLKKIKGYKFLKGDKNSFGNNSDAKIGLAFKNVYYSALKKIEKYTGGENDNCTN